jgi:transcriptional regulator with XRE-family HTH domain
MYLQARNEADLSREYAAEKLCVSTRTLFRIESGESFPGPQDVLNMQELYGQGCLSARYCAEECPIGMRYAYRVSRKELTVAVMGVLKEYKDVSREWDRLIEIVADGQISEDEKADFEHIISEFMDLEEKFENLKLAAAKVIPIHELVMKKRKTA